MDRLHLIETLCRVTKADDCGMARKQCSTDTSLFLHHLPPLFHNVLRSLAVRAEARNLRAAMQERIAQEQWIPLPYVVAYEALGWDARPLKEHRAYMLARSRWTDAAG